MLKIDSLNDWFAKMVEAQLDKHPNASPDALAIARGIMVGAALIAEAISDAAEAANNELAELVAETETVGTRCAELSAAVSDAGARVAAGLYDLPGPALPSAERAGAGEVERATMPAGEYRSAC